MEEYGTKAKCSVCGRRLSKRGMTKHLEACLAKGSPRHREGGGASAYHIVVDCPGAPPFWMHLLAPARASLADLDSLLRGIWLECCGHLSAFTIGGTSYDSDTSEWIDERPEDMHHALGDLLRPGMTFKHEYDFGTTTELRLRVVSELWAGGRDASIAVLARNEPPEVSCASCGGPGKWTCTECMWSEGPVWLCDDCAPQHDCGEEMLLPFVNSPRCGQCGYTGIPY